MVEDIFYSLICFSIFYLIYWLVIALQNWRKQIQFLNDINGPAPGLPFIGNVSVFNHPKLDASDAMYIVTLELAKKYGQDGIFKIFIGNEPMLYLTRPETVKQLLVDSVNINGPAEYQYHEPWVGNGLILSSGDKWRERRKLIAKGFHVHIIDKYVPTIGRSYKIFDRVISKLIDQKVNIFNYVENFSMDALCETFMGVTMNVQESANFGYLKAAKGASDAITKRFVSLLYKYDIFFWNSAIGSQYKKDVRLLHEFTERIIKERRQIVEKNIRDNVNLSPLQKRFCIVDYLLYECLQNNSIDEQGIREEIDTLMLGGFETSRANICWTIYLLGNHLRIQEKAVDELRRVFGDDCEREILIDDLKHLTYLDCVIKESLRLYPTVPMVGRCLIKDLEINGKVFPTGTTLWIQLGALHRCEDIFPNPESFNPDRFLPENSHGRDAYAYLPFSAGVRNCIGQRFAMLEVKLFLSNFLRSYAVLCETPMSEILPVLESTLITKHPVYVTLKKRNF